MSRTVRVDFNFQPYEHQRQAHAARQRNRFSVLVWHRRAGKTVFSVMELLLAAIRCERQRGRYGYIAPYLSQAKEIAWQYLCDFTQDIPTRTKNESELWVEIPNVAGSRSRIRIYGADNPDTLRGGYFDGVVLDEVADMRPKVWGEIVRPMLMDREGWGLFIGTPKGVNQFSDLYYGAISGGEDWKGWYGDLRRAEDTGVLSAKELAEARASMSPAEVAQELDCDFAAAVTNTLLPLGAVLEAQARTVAQEGFSYAPKILGIDVAREGDDRSCFFLRQGLVAFAPRVLRVADLMELASQAAQVIDTHQPDAVFVDKGGMGSGVLDRLRQLGHTNVIGIDFGSKPSTPQYENKRTEMWSLMADWVKEGGCLPSGQEIVADLTTPTYVYANDKGRMQLESKRKIKERGMRSPDVGDALALTFAMPVAPRSAPARPHRKRRDGRPAWDFNPVEVA